MARRAGLRLRRRLGQHFLVDREVLDAIVAVLAPAGSEDVLEIGCGIGTLTGALAEAARRVVALDIDPACVRAAQLTQRHRGNVRVLQADARHVEAAALGLGGRWLAAGNLPYQLTGVLLSRLFELDEPPARGVFLVQREVAARLAADAGDWSLATLAIRSIATVARERDVPPGAFLPPPAVHSAVVRIEPRPSLSPAARHAVLDIARLVFQQRRKTLRHGLRHALGGDEHMAAAALAAAGVEASRRPGTLALDEWSRLAQAVSALRAGEG